jgi:hypothetical protein
MLRLNWTGRTATVGRSQYRRQHSHRRSDADLELDFDAAVALSDKSLNLAETETRTLAQPASSSNWSRTLAKALPVVSACPWRDDFIYIVALHIDPLPFQSSIAFRVSIAKPQVSARRCFGE